MQVSQFNVKTAYASLGSDDVVKREAPLAKHAKTAREVGGVKKILEKEWRKAEGQVTPVRRTRADRTRKR